MENGVGGWRRRRRSVIEGHDREHGAGRKVFKRRACRARDGLAMEKRTIESGIGTARVRGIMQ